MTDTTASLVREIERDAANYLGGDRLRISPTGELSLRLDSVEQVKVIIAALSQPPAPVGWLPIETAPKDGTKIWAFAPDDDPQQVVVQWFEEGTDWAGWIYADEVLCDVAPDGATPTHWQPLPPAPSAPEEE